MTNSILSNIIANYLITKFPNYVVKATPQAISAPGENRPMNRTEILVWVARNPRYAAEIAVLDNYRSLPYRNIKKSYEIVISVGHKSLDDDTIIDEIIEEIETDLTNLDIDKFAPIMPLSNTVEFKDTEAVHWKQMYFDTYAIMNIDLHTTDGIT